MQFGAEGAGEASSRHVFPSYRFPESAALALSRAVQYAAFRRHPGGRILYFDEVDSGSARQEVKALLDSSSEAVLWLEGERARGILAFFGIPTARPDGTPESADAEHATVEVRSDPSFGPLIRLSRAGKPPVVRITPLTDRDVHEVVESMEIPTECGVEELLGRISQLIEELPWLCGMQGEIHRTQEAPARCGVALGADVKIGFCH